MEYPLPMKKSSGRIHMAYKSGFLMGNVAINGRNPSFFAFDLKMDL